MPFRRTTGIVSNLSTSDPSKEADVIITAATLGFAATYIKNDRPIQFDVDPLDVADQDRTAAFKSAVTKIDNRPSRPSADSPLLGSGLRATPPSSPAVAAGGRQRTL